MRQYIPRERIVRAELQREIGSRCPFCPSDDVGHFEIHHIDNNHKNHERSNLLFLCRQCHSKFTKREWPPSKARNRKDQLLAKTDTRQLESIPIEAFDYNCYSMQSSNGRIPEENANGSIANVHVIDEFRIKISLVQKDGRKWEGELKLKVKNTGELSFQYAGETEFEAGKRECYISRIDNEEYIEDRLFFKSPAEDKNYGNELLKRRIFKPVVK